MLRHYLSHYSDYTPSFPTYYLKSDNKNHPLQALLSVLSEKKKNAVRSFRAFLQDYQLENFHLPFKADTLTLGVYYPRATVRARIAQRMDTRFEDGMIDEVRRLRENGVTWERLESFGLEYREIARHLQGKTSREEMRELLLNSIRQFAKRQDIFFRKMEREGVVIHWIKEGDPEQAVKLCHLHLAGESLPPPEFQMCDIHYPRNSG